MSQNSKERSSKRLKMTAESVASFAEPVTWQRESTEQPPSTSNTTQDSLRETADAVVHTSGESVSEAGGVDEVRPDEEDHELDDQINCLALQVLRFGGVKLLRSTVSWNTFLNCLQLLAACD